MNTCGEKNVKRTEKRNAHDNTSKRTKQSKQGKQKEALNCRILMYPLFFFFLRGLPIIIMFVICYLFPLLPSTALRKSHLWMRTAMKRSTFSKHNRCRKNEHLQEKYKRWGKKKHIWQYTLKNKTIKNDGRL